MGFTVWNSNFLQVLMAAAHYLFELRDCERSQLDQWDDFVEALDESKEVGTLVAHSAVHCSNLHATSKSLRRSITMPAIT